MARPVPGLPCWVPQWLAGVGGGRAWGAPWQLSQNQPADLCRSSVSTPVKQGVNPTSERGFSSSWILLASTSSGYFVWPWKCNKKSGGLCL